MKSPNNTIRKTRPHPFLAAKIRARIAIASASLLLAFGTGCQNLSNLSKGKPAEFGFQSFAVKALVKKYSRPDAIPSDATQMTEEQRNVILNDFIFMTDVNYYKFTASFYQGRAVFDTATDIALVGLGSAGALTGGAASKAILAAISAGIAGSRVSINKNFFHDQASIALIAKMDAVRKTRLAEMQDAMANLSMKDYPLSRGLANIAEYYNAGTIIGALNEITATAGEEKAKATQDLKNTVTLTYSVDANTDLLRKFWQTDKAANGPKLEKWMKDHAIQVSIASFLRAKEYSAKREQAVADFNLK